MTGLHAAGASALGMHTACRICRGLVQQSNMSDVQLAGGQCRYLNE